MGQRRWAGLTFCAALLSLLRSCPVRKTDSVKASGRPSSSLYDWLDRTGQPSIRSCPSSVIFAGLSLLSGPASLDPPVSPHPAHYPPRRPVCSKSRSWPWNCSRGHLSQCPAKSQPRWTKAAGGVGVVMRCGCECEARRGGVVRGGGATLYWSIVRGVHHQWRVCAVG